jgi:phage pi2 protein 07
MSAKKSHTISAERRMEVMREEYRMVLSRLRAKHRLYNDLYAAYPENPEHKYRFTVCDDLLGFIETKQAQVARKIEGKNGVKIRVETDGSGRDKIRIEHGGEAVHRPEGDGEEWTY